MRIDTSGHQIDITPALREYVESKFARVARHFDHLLDARVILSVDKLDQKAEATLSIPGKTLHAEAVAPDMYAAIDKLKAAGIEPIAVGAGDGWPAAHYWYYFSVRECSEEVLTDAVTSLDFSDECFIRAGEDLEELIAGGDHTIAIGRVCSLGLAEVEGTQPLLWYAGTYRQLASHADV